MSASSIVLLVAIAGVVGLLVGYFIKGEDE